MTSNSLAARLIEVQNTDGGWGMTPGAPSGTEPTAIAQMALLHASTETAAAGAAQRARQWLLSRQREDGSWPLTDEVDGPSWTTLVAVLALASDAASEASAERGIAWILRQRGAGISWRARIDEWIHGQAVELDWDLHGWPWAAGTFSWIEPTSWALLALKHQYRGRQPPRAIAQRIRESERMIHDRSCPGGGWNYGNKRVLGVDMEPYPDTTALALLALQDSPRSTTTEPGLAALQNALRNHDSGLTLALSILCYRAYDRDAAPLRDRLTQRFAESGFLGETRTLGLAVLAMADTNNPLLHG